MVVGVIGLSACSFARGGDTCVERTYAAYARGQRDWQTTLARMIAARRPDLAEVSDISRRLQLALVERSKLRLARLSDHDPGRLAAVRTISQSLDSSLAWSESDERNLGESDEHFAELESQILSLRLVSDRHPDWGRLRNYFVTELSDDDEYREAHERFEQVRRQADSLLLTCRSTRE